MKVLQAHTYMHKQPQKSGGEKQRTTNRNEREKSSYEAKVERANYTPPPPSTRMHEKNTPKKERKEKKLLRIGCVSISCLLRHYGMLRIGSHTYFRMV